MGVSIIMAMAQKEVRVTLSKELKQKLESRAKALGIKPTEYIRSLIIEDFKSELKKTK